MSGKTKFLLWLKAALIRALKTFAQAAVSMIPAAVTIDAVDWKVVLGTAALAFVVSMLTSIAGLPEVEYEQKEIEREGAPDLGVSKEDLE